MLCTFVLLSSMLLLACKKHDMPQPTQKDIRLVSTKQFGSILTDKDGNTLYFFSIDANGQSGCTGGCLAAWPVFYKNAPTLDAGLNPNDFGSITRTDGAKQTTYKGWPLYYYASDAKAGDINGDGVGGIWFVSKPDYTVMLAKTQLVGLNGKNYTSSYTEGTGATLYVTDDWGKTLYAFSPDKFKKNNFTKPDFSNNAVWPIFEQSGIKNIPSTLDKGSFDTTNVFGKSQLTFKGWPLYYFSKDSSMRGSTKGVSVPTPGFWPVVNNNSATAPL